MSFQTAEVRRSKLRADAQRTILDSAESLLAEGGYDAFSIRKLTERCGYSAPTIYHHFRDKGGLLDAVLEEHFQRLLDLIRAVSFRPDPLDTIRARAKAFVEFGLQNPTHYRVLMTQRGADAKPLQSAEDSRGLLEQPWRQLIEQGRLREEHLDLAQQCCFALLHGLISLLTNRPDIEWSSGVVEESVEALLRGWTVSTGLEPSGASRGKP
ncbi:MAG TPA: TetR/AcrR family transcriptional regulator [Myxococcota bacterium]|nr:TetR/AcrR family transcriptional regulator [Myxococcota bacterium]